MAAVGSTSRATRRARGQYDASARLIEVKGMGRSHLVPDRPVGPAGGEDRCGADDRRPGTGG
jgi:hypothetical protein